MLPMIKFSQTLWFMNSNESFYDFQPSINNVQLVEVYNESFD